MKRTRARWFFPVVAVMATLTGCEAILGLDDERARTPDAGSVSPPELDGAAAPDAAPALDAGARLPQDPPWVVASLGNHTCAVGPDRRAFCWGDNAEGQLGNGTTAVSDRPVFVAPFDDVVDVSAGYTHSCLVRVNGDVYCWGKNDRGQLGDGTKIDRRAVGMLAMTNARKVGVAGWHTCAITSIGGVRCWGDGYYGALGDGAYERRTRYVDVQGLSGVRSLAVGVMHNCASTDQGKVYCWGRAIFGQLGYLVDGDAGSPDPSDPGSALPVPVPGLTDVLEVAAGEDHTCAVRKSGQVVCWGRGDYGELGDGQKTGSVVPVVPSNLPFAVHLGAGAFTSCGVVDSTSKIQCWGQNNFAQLGNGNASLGDGLPSSPVVGLAQMFRISTGEHSCAWRMDGKLFCWGRNDLGQVGVGRRTDVELLPVEVTFPVDAGAVSVDP